VRIPFSGYIQQPLSGGLATTYLAPTAAGLGIPRLTTASDPFEKYRFTQFRFRLLCDAGSTTGDSVACFIGKSAATAGVSTLLQAFETGIFSFVSTKQTVHGSWVNVPKTVLAGMLQWYQTQGGNAASDTEEDNQGTLYFVGSGTSNLHIEVRGMIELAVAADPANTPASLQSLLAKKELLEKRICEARIAGTIARDQEKDKLVSLFPVLKALTPASKQ